MVAISSRSEANSSAGGSRSPSHGSITVIALGGWNNAAARSVVPLRGAPQMMKSRPPAASRASARRPWVKTGGRPGIGSSDGAEAGSRSGGSGA